MRSLARAWIGIASLTSVALAGPAAGFEFFDGRLQVHGFAEAQIRTLARDMNGSDNWDLAQWYSVLSLEMEYMAVDSGWGPFDLLSFFGRVEARYDCVWTRACGMFPSVNSWGDRVAHLPMRMTDARRSGYQGSVFVGPTTRYSGIEVVPVLDERTAAVGYPQYVASEEAANQHRPLRFSQLHKIEELFLVAGPDEQYGTADDPAPFVFSEILSRCHFGSRELRGGDNGRGTQIMGGLEPGCPIRTFGRLADRPNPFSSLDLNPVLFGLDRIPNTADDASAPLPPVGSGELPFRPAPTVSAAGGGGASIARGIYYPSPALRKALDEDVFDSFDQNFRQAELEWNRGASQQDERELKELYADMEFLDSRLWVRAGKQNIVWGKTELFRTTDQFNPADLALATLPDLEEARIPLWSIRGVYSFYSVGPLEDVRLELAANLDDFEPADIGRCGEPFTVFAACNKTTGLFFHGVTGFGAAGEHRPPNPWSDASGFEYGARLEFRLGRFSFQLSDFFGYEDLPYADRLSDYSRNVDPLSGRPRRAGASGRCSTGQEASCLGLSPASGITPDGTALNLSAENRQAVLEQTPVNMQLFAMICSTSIGFNSIDPTSCGQSVFNSLALVILPGVFYQRDQAKDPNTYPVSATVSNALAGNAVAANILANLAGGPVPVVRLNADPCDAFRTGGCPAKGQAPISDFGPHPSFASSLTLNQVLTDEQEGLLGCGAFYGSDCEVDGVDFANTEASVFLESVVGSVGTISARGWNTVNGLAQPGTIGFDAGPIATRYVPGTGTVELPGSRAPGAPGYDPLVDGTTAGLVLPAVVRAVGRPAIPLGAVCALLQLHAAGGGALVTARRQQRQRSRWSLGAERVRSGQPVQRRPRTMLVGAAAILLGDHGHSSRSSGSNAMRCGRAARGDFGRTDFLWHSGGEVVLRYEKRNVLGFSTDFAEDVTKSNWSIESAWIDGQRFNDVNRARRHLAGRHLQPHRLGGPSDLHQLPEPAAHLLHQRAVLLPVRGRLQPRFHDQRALEHARHADGQHRLLQRSLAARLHLPLRPAVRVGRHAAEDHLPLHLELLGDDRRELVLRRRRSCAPTHCSRSPRWTPRSGKDAYHQGVENALAVVRDRDEVFFRLRYTW